MNTLKEKVITIRKIVNVGSFRELITRISFLLFLNRQLNSRFCKHDNVFTYRASTVWRIDSSDKPLSQLCNMIPQMKDKHSCLLVDSIVGRQTFLWLIISSA